MTAVRLVKPEDRDAAVRAAVDEFKASGGFGWGTNDCCHFAATVVAKITGEPLNIREFGEYSSMVSGWRIIVRNGGLAALIDNYLPRLGEDEEARSGDLVLISATVLGVVYRNRALGIREDGVGTHPLALVRYRNAGPGRQTEPVPFWKVG